jgi:hypothetical protein
MTRLTHTPAGLTLELADATAVPRTNRRPDRHQPPRDVTYQEPALNPSGPSLSCPTIPPNTLTTTGASIWTIAARTGLDTGLIEGL